MNEINGRIEMTEMREMTETNEMKDQTRGPHFARD